MRTIFFSLLTAVLLSGAAMAQQTGTLGVSGGYPGVSAHLGIDDVGLKGLGVRVNVGYQYVDPAGLSIGADLLYTLPVDTGDLPGALYAGLGAATIPSESFTVHGLVGVSIEWMELGLDVEDVSLFLEGGVSYGIEVYETPEGEDANTGIGFLARAGINYHFEF